MTGPRYRTINFAVTCDQYEEIAAAAAGTPVGPYVRNRFVLPGIAAAITGGQKEATIGAPARKEGTRAQPYIGGQPVHRVSARRDRAGSPVCSRARRR